MRGTLYLIFLALLGCGATPDAPIHERPSDARAANGEYICWKEHPIDEERLGGGVPMRGPAALATADFDRDGALDVVTVYGDSAHVRIAYGKAGADDDWFRLTLAEGEEAAGVYAAVASDYNGDGWTDVAVAGDRPLLLTNPASEHRGFRWVRAAIDGCDNDACGEGGDPRARRIVNGEFELRSGVFADIDEDGEEDLLASSEDGLLAWFQNAGGEWESHEIVRLEGTVAAWAAADLDGDGDTDFLAAREGAVERDGLFWLEQQRAKSAVQRYQPAIEEDWR